MHKTIDIPKNTSNISTTIYFSDSVENHYPGLTKKNLAWPNTIWYIGPMESQLEQLEERGILKICRLYSLSFHSNDEQDSFFYRLEIKLTNSLCSLLTK